MRCTWIGVLAAATNVQHFLLQRAARALLAAPIGTIRQARVWSPSPDYERTTWTAWLRPGAIGLRSEKPAAATDGPGRGRDVNWEATPIVVNGVMHVPAADRVVALQPESGKEIWEYSVGGRAPPRGGLTGGAMAAVRGAFSSPRDAG